MKVDQLAGMLVSVGLVHEDAVFDSDCYDCGQTYDNIYALYDKLFPVQNNATGRTPAELVEIVRGLRFSAIEATHRPMGVVPDSLVEALKKSEGI